MRKSILLAAVAALAVSTGARAESNPTQKADAAVPPVKAAKPLASKAVRLSDAELDKIVAGDATQLHTGNGITIIVNPGKAEVFNRHNHRFACINLCF